MLVVTVCTANLCRSPFAEHVLDRAIRVRRSGITVRSTGIDVIAGQSSPRAWLQVAGEFGVDLGAHRSRSPEGLLDEADLVLAMTAEHLRVIAVGWPSLIGRATTLGEAAARVADIGSGIGADIDGLVGHLVAPRTATEVLATPRVHDVDDPVGHLRRTQRRVAAELVDLCERVAGAWPVAGGLP